MSFVIIPHEYIVPEEAAAEASLFADLDISIDLPTISSVIAYADGKTAVNWHPSDGDAKFASIVIDLSVPEVCALIADALKSSPAPVRLPPPPEKVPSAELF